MNKADLKIIEDSEHIAPSYFCIRAMQCGTALLFSLLCKIQKIKNPPTREFCFFASDEEYAKGLNYYLSNFPLKKDVEPGDISGEAISLYHDKVPGRVHRSFPNAKLIILLMNPVTRANAHFNYNVCQNKTMTNLTFEKSLLLENMLLANPLCDRETNRSFSFKARGRYAEQLKRWLQYYPKEQILCIKSEDFFKRQNDHMEKICHFLGVPHKPSSQLSPAYIEHTIPMRESTKLSLVKYFEPYNQDLYDLLGVDFQWH